MIGEKGKLRQIGFYILSGILLVVVLAALGTQVVNAVPVWLTSVDDGGADDYPGQKDLNFLETGIDLDTPGELYFNWGLDNTDWSGNNTGDVCVLFDSSGDGMADYSFCVTVNGAPAAITKQVLWTCGGAAADKCTNPRDPIVTATSSATLEIAEVDPFGVPTSPDYDPLHVTGNTCSLITDPSCYTFDTYVKSIITPEDLTLMGSPKMINVCSYPSDVPGSAPSDCIFLAGAGFLEIVKVANPDNETNFVFNLGDGQASANGTSSWTITGSGSTSDQSIYSFVPGTGYDLSEIVPNGWTLTDASCVLNNALGTPTGTWSGTTITDFAIQTGLTTTCTFTNEAAVDVTVTKTDYDYARPTYGYPIYPYPGSLLPYSITVTNKDMPGDVPAEGVVVTDTLDAYVFYDGTVPFTITSDTDNDGLPRSCSHVGGVVTCNLGSMAPDEVVTIDFAVRVGAAPTFFLIEKGECIQGTPYNLQGEIPVDVCNIVSVTATNELEPYTVDNSDSEPTDLGVPTAVTINKFTATGEAGAIRLDWETEMEIDNMGFYLYRAHSLKGPRTKINDEIIPGTPGGVGAKYSYVDEVNSRNRFFYWLESVDIYGNAELHEDFASAMVLKKLNWKK